MTKNEPPKTSLIDHMKDAKHTFTFLIFTIIMITSISLLSNTDYSGLLNFMYYVAFLGGIYILYCAYDKRQQEVEYGISEKIKWSWVSISLIVYIFSLFLSQFINFGKTNGMAKLFDYIDNDGLTYFFLMVPIFFLIIMLFFKRKNDYFDLTNTKEEPGKLAFILKLLTSIMLFIVPILIIYTMLFITEFEKDFPYTAIILTIILSFMIIALLFMAFNITKKKVFSSSKINTGHSELSFTNLMKYSILYVPCLINEFIDYLKYEYRITTTSSVVTLSITSIILASYLILPIVRKKLFNYGSTQLLEGPVYLSSSKRLGSFNDLTLNISSNTPIIDMYNYTYCISFWVNINPQPPNTSPVYNDYISIFDYGKKPQVLYKASNNHLLIKMVQGKDGEDIIYKSSNSLDFKLQKWNHFCINYNKGTLDIFLNNELIATKSEIIPYVDRDSIVCGSAGGIEGGICNVKYYNKILSKNQIDTEYENFKDKNPPIV